MIISKIRDKISALGLDAILLRDPYNRRYVSGFPSSSGDVIITPNEAYFITDSRYTEAAAKAISGMTLAEATVKRPGKTILREIINACGVKKLGFEEDYITFAAHNRLLDDLQCELIPAGNILIELRKSKTREELELLIKAQRIAETALHETIALLRPGIMEREIAAELTYRMAKLGAEGNSFEPIAVSGKNSSMPHGVPGDNIIKNGDFVVIDFGCVFGGYCSDMTRTIAVGEPSGEMRRVYNTVLKAQLSGIAAAKPGVSGEEIDGAARKIIADAGYGDYFGHSFGHSLGLEVHESPRCAPNSKDIMPEGAVISAEPGIYLPGKFGVRIEDVLYLTAGGCKNITGFPKELIVI